MSETALATTTGSGLTRDTSRTYINPLLTKWQSRIQECKAAAEKKLAPLYQFRQFEARMREFVDHHYRGDDLLHRQLDNIFSCLASNPLDAPELLTNKIRGLVNNAPSIFTFFPSITSHQSISQYDINLVDMTSDVESRSKVELTTQVSRDKRTKMNGLLLNAPMRAVVNPDFAHMLAQEGLIVVYHRFRRPLSPEDCDQDPQTHGGQQPLVQSKDEWIDERRSLVKSIGQKTFMAVGVAPEKPGEWPREIDFAKELIDAGALGVCLDIALANSDQAAAGVLELKEHIRLTRSDAQLMVGNVDTQKGYLLMAECGADVVKVGIGPGSNCTTRGTTGAGKGQGSALMSAARARFVWGPGAPDFIADGGIEGAVDVIRAVALGASCAMGGKVFSKCEESGALKRLVDGELKAWSFGEASKWSQIYSRGGVKRGCAEEGKGSWIPVKYRLRDFIADMRAQWSNSLTYYSAHNPDELRDQFRIERQLVRLIRGEETGIELASSSIPKEAGTRMV